jgi:hypothetical protein
MNPADEMAAKIEPTERHLGGAVAGSDDSEQLRVSAEDLLRPGPQPKPVDDLQNLLLRISHHLDDEASERKAEHGAGPDTEAVGYPENRPDQECGPSAAYSAWRIGYRRRRFAEGNRRRDQYHSHQH